MQEKLIDTSQINTTQLNLSSSKETDDHLNLHALQFLTNTISKVRHAILLSL